jgi:hypothetical protein
MQRRLSEELKDIQTLIQSIKDKYAKGELSSDYVMWEEYTELTGILYKLLSAPDKSFEVLFEDRIYNFIYPTTKEEYSSMRELRLNLIWAIFEECYDQMVAGKDTWWMVTAFASGIDTLDMQVEIVGKEEMITAKSDDGSNPSVPLDVSNYQVKQELENDIEVIQEDQTMDSF